MKKVDEPPYSPPAGGWGALASSAKHLAKSKNMRGAVRSLLRANQAEGFDCPGCAWGEEADSTTFDICENGIKAVAWEVTGKLASPAFFAQHTLSELQQWDGHALESAGRLASPMLYDGVHPHFVPISWERAFNLIAEKLKSLETPDALLLYTSGRASNEASYLYQLFGRLFGTNNFPDCSNMCHEPSGVGLTASIGSGKGTVVMEDFAAAEAIFVFGQNPGTNHPRMLATLSKASKRGAQVVAINTLQERGLQRFTRPQDPKEMLIGSSSMISQHYLTPKLGGDMALLRGIAKVLLERMPERLDQAFIEEHCQGFEAYRQVVLATSWEKIIGQSGIARDKIELLAGIYGKSDRTIFTWAMGITQHAHSVATVRELVNVLLLRGNIGKTGAGACPVRGHSNVQGNRTMGIVEHPPAWLLEALADRYHFSPPQHSGVNTVESIHAMLEGKAKVFIGLGGNFAAATPDTELTCKALSRCELIVNIATKLNRSHVTVGRQSLILPCLGRTEQDLQVTGEQAITVEDSMSMVHRSKGLKPPAAPTLKSETAIVAEMAEAVLGNDRVNWAELRGDYGLIRDEIAAVIPGFENFNERVAEPKGFHLSNPAAERRWQTASGRAEFSADLLPHQLFHERTHAAGAGLFTLQSLRSHDQYNTTVYGMDDRYRGVHGKRNVVFINPEDMVSCGLAEGDSVDLQTVSSDSDSIVRRVTGFRLVPYQIPRGCLAAYYPEVNPLVPLDSTAEGCGTPTYKSIPVRLHITQ